VTVEAVLSITNIMIGSVLGSQYRKEAEKVEKRKDKIKTLILVTKFRNVSILYEGLQTWKC
jgi:hypothetical protein